MKRKNFVIGCESTGVERVVPEYRGDVYTNLSELQAGKKVSKLHRL